MEKGTPHCKLSLIRGLIDAGRVRITNSAIAGGVIAAVKALTPADFYKSMTTHGDHRVWQDVYRPATTAGDVYVKLMVIDDLLIVSFKEL